ncbi:MAG: ATP-binding protein, partial [Deltaproteobacteria bacterium]|nr:ATP-binding protein [Deltaproteobacteria bacterium]
STEKESVEDILSQVKRAIRIINNMKSFAHQGHISTDEIILAGPVRDAVDFFSAQFRVQQIEMLLEIDDDIPLLMMDYQKFEQVVVNLVVNARYAVQEMGKIRGEDFKKKIAIRLINGCPEKEVLFEITDNGIGMSAEVRERCVDPFYTTKKVGEGTGLGLSIVDSILKDFEITMEIQSEELKGCAIRLRIPCP